MARTLALVIAFSVIILTGVAHGLWTHRWNPSNDLVVAAERVKSVPHKLGDWEGEFTGLSEDEKRIGGIQDGITGRFVHRTRKTEVQFLLVCGHPRAIALHTPESCYAGSGFSQVGDPTRQSVKPEGGGPEASLQVGMFEREQAGIPEVLRIMWTFSPDGVWGSPDSPRSAFSGQRYLYKMYVVRRVAKSDEALEKDDPSLDLIRQLLPELQKALFPSPQA
jgi:hypothetical protein